MLRRDFLKTLGLGAGAVTLAPELFAAVGEPAPAPRVLLGIDVLESRDFADVRGLRLGLCTHPAGVNSRGESTITVLLRAKAKGVKLTKLFGPEHGIYGTEKAEIPIQNSIDRRTGLPVFSLYGKTRKPTRDMLEGLDAMVVDFQDIGCRSYTYVSCMRYVIEACFEAGVRVIVLDRPNPLGGYKVDGPPRDADIKSYVAMYPVPYVHGLTIGELARIAVRTPGWLDLPSETAKKGRLTVIPMRGWKRSMRWEHTGLKWVPTSPKIPNPAAATGYAMTGLGTYIGAFYHGYGPSHPFRWVGFPGKKADALAAAFRAAGVPGLDPRPKVMPDGGQGVYLDIADWTTLRPCEISFHMMRLSCAWEKRNPFWAASDKEMSGFINHVGSAAWAAELRRRGSKADVKGFVNRWADQAEEFRLRCKPLFLYT